MVKRQTIVDLIPSQWRIRRTCLRCLFNEISHANLYGAFCLYKFISSSTFSGAETVDIDLQSYGTRRASNNILQPVSRFTLRLDNFARYGRRQFRHRRRAFYPPTPARSPRSFLPRYFTKRTSTHYTFFSSRLLCAYTWFYRFFWSLPRCFVSCWARFCNNEAIRTTLPS